VRYIYADESGISVNESVTVVAAVIIDADKQWRAVEKEIEALIHEYVPGEHRQDFVFHAKDLFAGSGHIFDRNKYPRERSGDALKQLLALPRRLGLPVVFGMTRKEPIPDSPTKLERREKTVLHHSYTFALCVLAAENYLREYTDESEVATLIAEINTDTQRVLKATHFLMQGKDRTSEGAKAFALLNSFAGHLMPIKRIVDTVHFAEKNGAILLQLADACAMTIRHYFEDKPYSEEFIAAFVGNPGILGPKEVTAAYNSLVPKKSPLT
jgi:hypothetical protein